MYSCADPEYAFRRSSQGFVCHQRISQRAVRRFLDKQLDPMGPIASRGVSVSGFLRKPIAACDFSGSSGPPAPPFPIDLPIVFQIQKYLS